MDIKDIPKILWILLPIVYYVMPLLGVGAIFTFIPYLIFSIIYVSSHSILSYKRIFLLPALFCTSNFINYYYEGNAVGMLASFSLFIFILTSLNSSALKMEDITNIAKRLFLGIVILFVFVIYLPLLAHYSYTIGSWYYLAFPDVAYIRTTYDGPLCLIVITAAIYIYLNYSEQNLFKYFVFFLILLIVFYTLLVFNRRTVLFFFVLLIPLIFSKFALKPYVYRILFIISFLTPIYFASFLLFANRLSHIPIIHSLTLRSSDLNPEDNQRLRGWILALTNFRDISFADFFKFHKILVRSTNERYNHFHNGYIQLYYEQGIFGFVVLMCLYLYIFSKIKYLKKIDFSQHKFILIPLIIFLLTILICITESVFRALYPTNVLFIICSFIIIKTADVAKNEREVYKI